MEQITVEEAQRRLPELLKRAAAGERITINGHGQTVEMVASREKPSDGDLNSTHEVQPADVESKTMLDLFEPLRGLEIDFERDRDTGRDIDL